MYTSVDSTSNSNKRKAIWKGLLVSLFPISVRCVHRASLKTTCQRGWSWLDAIEAPMLSRNSFGCVRYIALTNRPHTALCVFNALLRFFYYNTTLAARCNRTDNHVRTFLLQMKAPRLCHEQCITQWAWLQPREQTELNWNHTFKGISPLLISLEPPALSPMRRWFKCRLCCDVGWSVNALRWQCVS
jgi:hypothetical protein